MIVLPIDPGVHQCSCGWLRDEELARVFYMRPQDFAVFYRDPADRPDIVIVERPEYQGARSDGARAQDLMALSWAGARAAYSVGCPVVREYTPGEWKRSEPKPPQHLRLWEDCLTDTERKLFPPDTRRRVMAAAEKCALHPGRPGADYYGRGKGSEVHNLLDAAAMGLAFVGRFR